MTVFRCTFTISWHLVSKRHKNKTVITSLITAIIITSITSSLFQLPLMTFVFINWSNSSGPIKFSSCNLGEVHSAFNSGRVSPVKFHDFAKPRSPLYIIPENQQNPANTGPDYLSSGFFRNIPI